MEKSMRLWFKFAKSGKPADYLRYAEAKRKAHRAGIEDIAPSEAASSIEGIPELSQRG